MAIAYDAAAPGTITQSAASNLTSSTFTVGSGSDRALFGFILTVDGTPAAHSSFKWRGSGGTSATQIGSSFNVGSYGRISAWSLVAPTSATDTIYGSWAASQLYSGIGAAAYTGVNQSTPAGSLATNSGSVSNDFGFNATAVVSTTSGDVILAFTYIADGNGSTPLMTPGGTPLGTGRAESENSIISYCIQEVVATGASTTVTCGIAPTSSNMTGDWGMVAFVVQSAAAGTTPIKAMYYNRNSNWF